MCAHSCLHSRVHVSGVRSLVRPTMRRSQRSDLGHQVWHQVPLPAVHFKRPNSRIFQTEVLFRAAPRKENLLVGRHKQTTQIHQRMQAQFHSHHWKILMRQGYQEPQRVMQIQTEPQNPGYWKNPKKCRRQPWFLRTLPGIIQELLQTQSTGKR